jgi:hypothetical protein
MRKLLLAALAFVLLPFVPALAETAGSVPPAISIPWANSAGGAYVRAIPNASQIGIQNCAASFTDGFPPLTFVPASAGGCPPFGQDFNGILKNISQWSRWQTMGGPIYWNSAFSGVIGGYANGARVQQLAVPRCLWISTVDNNTTNPDTGGANWTNTCAVGGSLTGTLPNPGLAANSVGLAQLVASGVSSGTYVRPQLTVDITGRITAAASGAQPTYSSSGPTTSTYVPSAGVVRAHVILVAGGGNGGSNGGGTGGTSSFGSWTAIGGSPGTNSGGSAAGGAGGTGGSNGTGRLALRLPGGNGKNGFSLTGTALSGSVAITCSTAGGLNHFGGGPNSGEGGVGLGTISVSNSSLNCSGGGGAGEYVEFDVFNPTSTGFTVGAGAGNAQSGILSITEYYD